MNLTLALKSGFALSLSFWAIAIVGTHNATDCEGQNGVSTCTAIVHGGRSLALGPLSAPEAVFCLAPAGNVDLEECDAKAE